MSVEAPGRSGSVSIVRLELARGALHVGGTNDARLVMGHFHASDPTLLPHVTVNARGASFVQDFLPERGSTAKIAWDLKLGGEPVQLDVHVIDSEDDHVDLGGVAVAKARLYCEGGHLDLDWTAPNPRVAERLELWSIGYLSVRHLARAHAKMIELKNVGLATIDFGEIDSAVDLDVVSSVGTLVLTLPSSASAEVTTLPALPAFVDAPLWSHDADGHYSIGAPGSALRIKIRIDSASGTIKLRSEGARDESNAAISNAPPR